MKNTVPETSKKKRSEVLEKLGEETARAFTEANLGVIHTVLVEEANGGYAEGYTGNYIKTYIEDPDCQLEAGSLYTVRLTEAFRDGALAVPANDPCEIPRPYACHKQ